MLTHVVKAGTGGLVDPGILVDIENQEITTAWKRSEQARRHFQEQLEEATTTHGLILFIDELDRCQPSYVLELLSTVRHLFAVPGVVVVLTINRIELAHSVQSVYGPDFSADHYLRRFADLHVQLLRPTQPELIPLFQQLIGQAGESSLGDRGIWEMLSLVGEAQGCGLRDIQQATHHYSAVIATYGTTPLRDPNNLRYPIAALIAFRVLDRKSYQSMINVQINGFQAITALRKSLSAADAIQPSADGEDLERAQIGG